MQATDVLETAWNLDLKDLRFAISRLWRYLYGNLSKANKE